jgi:hypothetical protein
MQSLEHAIGLIPFPRTNWRERQGGRKQSDAWASDRQPPTSAIWESNKCKSDEEQISLNRLAKEKTQKNKKMKECKESKESRESRETRRGRLTRRA